MWEVGAAAVHFACKPHLYFSGCVDCFSVNSTLQTKKHLQPARVRRVTHPNNFLGPVTKKPCNRQPCLLCWVPTRLCMDVSIMSRALRSLGKGVSDNFSDCGFWTWWCLELGCCNAFVFDLCNIHWQRNFANKVVYLTSQCKTKTKCIEVLSLTHGWQRWSKDCLKQSLLRVDQRCQADIRFSWYHCRPKAHIHPAHGRTYSPAWWTSKITIRRSVMFWSIGDQLWKTSLWSCNADRVGQLGSSSSISTWTRLSQHVSEWCYVFLPFVWWQARKQEQYLHIYIYIYIPARWFSSWWYGHRIDLCFACPPLQSASKNRNDGSLEAWDSCNWSPISRKKICSTAFVLHSLIGNSNFTTSLQVS